MRDFSIRGAGNLLGAQQHGFIDSVGFDLYSQMLKEAIEERKSDLKTDIRQLLRLILKLMPIFLTLILKMVIKRLKCINGLGESLI